MDVPWLRNLRPTLCPYYKIFSPQNNNFFSTTTHGRPTNAQRGFHDVQLVAESSVEPSTGPCNSVRWRTAAGDIRFDSLLLRTVSIRHRTWGCPIMKTPGLTTHRTCTSLMGLDLFILGPLLPAGDVMGSHSVPVAHPCGKFWQQDRLGMS